MLELCPWMCRKSRRRSVSYIGSVVPSTCYKHADQQVINKTEESRRVVYQRCS